MNWNAKPNSATMPPLRQKSQSTFLQQALINPLASTSQSSFNYPRSNQEACMYPRNLDSQPLINIKNYATSQQISFSDMHNGTHVASQTSVEIKISPNVKGPKQLNHSLHMSSGVAQNSWLSSTMKNSKLSQTRTTVDFNQTDFGANPSTVHLLQNQFVSSDTYSMQLQTIPSNSGRGPVIYQGNQGLNPSLSEQQVDWAQMQASSGTTFPDYRSPSNSQQKSRGHVLQKQNPMLSALLHAKNNPLSNSALFLQSQQSAPVQPQQSTPVQSQQYAVSQIENRLPPSYDCTYAPVQSQQNVAVPPQQSTRVHSQQYAISQIHNRPPPSYGYKYIPVQSHQSVAISPQKSTPVHSQNVSVQLQQYEAPQIDNRPPPPNYDCKYASPPLQNAQLVGKHSPKKITHDQEINGSEIPKGLCGDMPQWKNPNKEINTTGNVFNLQLNSVSQLVNKPIGSLVNGVQPVAQKDQDKSMISSNLTSPQVLDTSVTKEGLASDIKTLLEMKKKFFELARKIRINKDLLMAAGCHKACNSSHGESAQNSELSVKQLSKIQLWPQVNQVTAKTPEGQPTAVMKCIGETTNTQKPTITNIQNIGGKTFTSDKPILLNSDCLETVSVTDQFHDLQASLNSSTVEFTQALNNTQFELQNVKGDQKLSTNAETVTVSDLVLLKEHDASKPTNEKTVFQFLWFRDKGIDGATEGASGTTQDLKANNSEMNQNAQLIGEPSSLKTMETQCTSNENTKISDKSCLDQKCSANEVSSKSDDYCSMELLTTCLSLWKKSPSESTKERHTNESSTNRTTVGVSKPVERHAKSPCVVMGNVQNNKTIISEQQQAAMLPVVVQNYEPHGTNVTKGPELQIAVVSPLNLSDDKAMSVKTATPEALLEPMYPVIKEGSVCSLQDQLAENKSLPTAMKADSNELGTTPSTEISPLSQKEEQDKSTNYNSEGIPGASQENKSNSPSSTKGSLISLGVSGNQQVLYHQTTSETLQIASICSLVEGDRSYNSQIAKIFNSPCLNKVKPQETCSPEQQRKSQQKEVSDKDMDNKSFGFQKEKIVEATDVSPKPELTDVHLQSSELSSLKCAEASGEILEESNKECTITNAYCSAVGQQAIPETDKPCSYTGQDPASSAIPSDKTSVLYLCDQLSELLEEFPYGIEPANSRDDPVDKEVVGKVSKMDQNCDKARCDSQDSTDQIKITILNSEQMKELFSEEDDQPKDGDQVTEPQKENPTTKPVVECDQKVHTGQGRSVVLNFQKDDIHCCALGWLSLIYEGVPQCQCKSKNWTPKEEKKDQHSPLDVNKCQQGDKNSDLEPTVECNSPPNKDLKISVTAPGGQQGDRISDRDVTVKCSSSTNKNLKVFLPDGKNLLPQIKQDNIKDQSKAKHNNSLKTERAMCDKKLDPLQSHKRKRKLQFHEVTFCSNSKIMKLCEQDSQERLQRKHMAQNSSLPKTKAIILTTSKNSSLTPTKSPEKKKLKFKAGSSRYKLLDRRKPDCGITFDMIERRKKKYDQQEQNKNLGTSFNLCSSLSNSNERTSIKERTVSIDGKSTNLHINSHKSLMKFSNSNINFPDSPDVSCQTNNQVLTPKDCLQRHKEMVSSKAAKKSVIAKMKNVPCDSEYTRPSKHPTLAEGSGKSNERDSTVTQTSKEPLNILTSHDKTITIHHPKESNMHNSSKVIKGKGKRRKQPDKIWMDKAQTDKHLDNRNNESPQTTDQGKRYLNRIAFKCTEHESISLSKLDNSPRKPNDTKRIQENNSKSLLPVKVTIKKPPMLEFKFCPDTIFSNKIGEDENKLKPSSRKEQAPVQGMKSTKEAWLKCVNTNERVLDANQRIGNTVLPISKLPKRSISMDGLETLQSTVKDSKEIFQTFKKKHMAKKSTGNSP